MRFYQGNELEAETNQGFEIDEMIKQYGYTTDILELLIIRYQHPSQHGSEHAREHFDTQECIASIKQYGFEQKINNVLASAIS